MLYDIAIVGGGPAGLAAALNGRQRNKSVLLFDRRGADAKLGKANSVDNYLGQQTVSGKELLDSFTRHAEARGVLPLYEQITNIYLTDGMFSLLATNLSWQARTVIFAAGAPAGRLLPGEEEFLGRGVSYCATCDGLLFKNKKIAIIAECQENEETGFLAGLCKEILYFPLYKDAYPEYDNLTVLAEKPLLVEGADKIAALRTDKDIHPVDGVFIFRQNLPPGSIIEGLLLEDNFIKTDKAQRTNIPGFFAAGDCTGRPWQINRAAGEGQVAALSAVGYLADNNRD